MFIVKLDVYFRIPIYLKVQMRYDFFMPDMYMCKQK